MAQSLYHIPMPVVHLKGSMLVSGVYGASQPAMFGMVSGQHLQHFGLPGENAEDADDTESQRDDLMLRMSPHDWVQPAQIG